MRAGRHLPPETEVKPMSRRYRGPRYRPYHGRRSTGARAVLKWIIVFLLAVLVVATVVFLYLQNNLIYYDGGVRVVLPWSSQQAAQESTEPSPSPSASEPVLVTESPEPDAREEAEQTLHAVEVSQTALLAGSAAEQVRAAGGNAAVVTLKNDDGTLNYVSSVPLAVEAQTSSTDSNLNTALADLIQNGELYTVARVSCFRDQALPGYDSELAIHTNSGYRLEDLEKVRWSSPASQTVRDYLTALCVELAQMGFDEILLDHCGYPLASEANLGWIRQGDAYPAGSLDTILTPFLEQVKEALAPYGTKLSVIAAGSELAGETADTGLTMTNVLANCDHVWVTAEDAASYANFAGASADLSEKLVPISSARGSDEEAWAILNGY